jgi:hypothetical protein
MPFSHSDLTAAIIIYKRIVAINAKKIKLSFTPALSTAIRL